MDLYSLSRQWFDWSFENPELIKPSHTALYFFCIEHCNRLGWKDKFGLPTTMAKDAIGIKSYHTYIDTLNDLISWGFIKLIQKSTNQYSSNIIAIAKNIKAHSKALDKAMIKHSTKQSQSTVQSIDSIDIQNTSIQLYNNTKIPFSVFWDLYDKKVGNKTKCETKWNKLKIEIQQKIISTLPLFVSQFKDKQYQPYPETYLNGERWNDEIILQSNQLTEDELRKQKQQQQVAYMKSLKK